MAAFLLPILPFARAGDFSQGLIARWTFNNKPGEPLLVDDIAKLPLEPNALPGADPTITVNPDGTITVGPQQFLVAPGINSVEYPQLASGVTIWMRLRIDKVEAPHTSFLFGLFTKPRADWKNAALTLVHRPKEINPSGMAVYGHVGEGQDFAGDKALADHVGNFITAAITFDGSNNTMSVAIDGDVAITKKLDARILTGFQYFSLGRVSAEGQVTLTVDEIRIYSPSVPLDQLNNITPIKAVTKPL